MLQILVATVVFIEYGYTVVEDKLTYILQFMQLYKQNDIVRYQQFQHLYTIAIYHSKPLFTMVYYFFYERFINQIVCNNSCYNSMLLSPHTASCYIVDHTST